MMMVMSRRSPVRFIVFLVLLAGLISYVAIKWNAFHEQTAALDDQWSTQPVVVVPGEGTIAGDEAGEAAGDAASEEGGEPVVSTDIQSVPDAAFFVESRIEREQARSARIELLEGLINNPEVNEETRQRAEEELINLSRRITQEAEIEGLVRARGFEDAIVYLYDDAAVVIVKADGITAQQAAQVADAVVKVASVPVSGISVMARPGD